MNRLAGNYESNGWEKTNIVEDADRILMASCVVTKKAEKDFMRVFNRFRRMYPEKKIEITGCFNFSVKEEPNIDFIEQETILKIKEPTSFRVRPEIVIQTGCNNFCSYCIVPYKRGKERSRSFEEILFDVKKYIEKNKKEIVLTGVHIGKYDSKGMNLTDILRELKKSGIRRIRLSSLDINEITDSLIEEMKKDNITSRFIHLSLQHTEERVLRDMKRNTSREKIFETIRKLQSISGIRFGADIIYNFPSETEKDFDNLLKSLDGLPITHFHLFAFSSRIKTLASYYEERKEEKERKLKLLREMSERKKKEYLESIIGNKDEIIIEKMKNNYCYGKSSTYVNCRIEADNETKIGDMVEIIYDSLENGIMQCKTG